MKPAPVETRLLGLSPAQYTRLQERARRDAVRLRREAIEEAFAAIGRALRSLAAPASRPARVANC